MDIFSNQAGSVVAMPSPGIPMGMFLEGFGGYVPLKAIVTGFGLRMSSGVTFMHSMRDFVYTYIYGERMAPLTITGVAFAFACERFGESLHNPFTGQTLFLPSFHGLEYVNAYYNFYRVSSRGAPVVIILGLSTVLYGFLTDADIGMQNAEHKLVNFTFTFKAAPQSSIIDMVTGGG